MARSSWTVPQLRSSPRPPNWLNGESWRRHSRGCSLNCLAESTKCTLLWRLWRPPSSPTGRPRFGQSEVAVLHSLLVRTVISNLLVFTVPLLLPIAFFKLVGLGGLRELVTYEAKDTPLHRLDPRLKVLYPIAMGI